MVKASAEITSEALKKYFELIENQLKQQNKGHVLNKPRSWWNIDETGFEMNPMPQIVYAKKGVKTILYY